MRVPIITKRYILSLGLMILMVPGAAQSTSSETLAVRADGSDSVFFRSSARLEFIEGVTSNLVGSLDLNHDDPARSTGRFRVDLRTLETGIETRDKHMRERHLHTDKFPYAYFEFTAMKEFDPKSPIGEEQACQGEGLFYIHGVKRSMAADLIVTKLAQEGGAIGYRIRATYQLTLDDYQIPRPKLLFLKLAEIIEVEVVLELHPVPNPTSLPSFSSFPSFPSFPDFKLID